MCCAQKLRLSERLAENPGGAQKLWPTFFLEIWSMEALFSAKLQILEFGFGDLDSETGPMSLVQPQRSSMCLVEPQRMVRALFFEKKSFVIARRGSLDLERKTFLTAHRTGQMICFLTRVFHYVILSILSIPSIKVQCPVRTSVFFPKQNAYAVF